METSPLSDEALLRGLREHPHNRNRMASLLELAQGANPELKRADDAKDGLIQEIRALGTQTLQAWAHSQVHQTEQEVRHSARAQRGGKKTLLARHLWRHNELQASLEPSQTPDEDAPVRRCYRLMLGTSL